jgi:hypothetical protein
MHDYEITVRPIPNQNEQLKLWIILTCLLTFILGASANLSITINLYLKETLKLHLKTMLLFMLKYIFIKSFNLT